MAAVSVSVSGTDRAPVRISKVAGRYLLFDIDDIMHLRRHHNICSVFVGTTPQNPQQNIFMGLPVELMPEEAQVLVDKKVAYIFDDGVFHPARLATLDEPTRRAYLQSLKHEGKMAQLVAEESKKQFVPKVKQGKKKSKASRTEAGPAVEDPVEQETSTVGEKDVEDTIDLFDSSTPASLTSKPKSINNVPTKAEPEGYFVTPTTTSALLLTPTVFPHLPPSPPAEPSECGGLSTAAVTPASVDNLPASYPLYAHLQDKGYYMMPGLRFGCDYNVYPGDPLRFHSHFQATHVGWEDEITMLDVVTGGRLGTNVKKGFLLGGAVTSSEPQTAEGETAGSGDAVRTFCVEWAAM
ncbi:tRNA intron endonuclease [Camillea tinctor]|nr:tRNA intron endonuclease [Camillea tinctor]